MAGAGVAALMGEDRVELVVGEASQGAGGDDQLRGTAGHPPGVRVLVLQDQQGAAFGGEPGGQIGGALAQVGAGPGPTPACFDQLAGEHGGRPRGATGQQQGEGGGPRRAGGEVVGRGHRGRRRGEELGADGAEDGGGPEDESGQAAQQDGGDQALPHPQRDHRITFGPGGTGQRARYRYRGGHGDDEQQEQAEGHATGSGSWSEGAALAVVRLWWAVPGRYRRARRLPGESAPTRARTCRAYPPTPV